MANTVIKSGLQSDEKMNWDGQTFVRQKKTTLLVSAVIFYQNLLHWCYWNVFRAFAHMIFFFFTAHLVYDCFVVEQFMDPEISLMLQLSFFCRTGLTRSPTPVSAELCLILLTAAYFLVFKPKQCVWTKSKIYNWVVLL